MYQLSTLWLVTCINLMFLYEASMRESTSNRCNHLAGSISFLSPHRWDPIKDCFLSTIEASRLLSPHTLMDWWSHMNYLLMNWLFLLVTLVFILSNFLVCLIFYFIDFVPFEITTAEKGIPTKMNTYLGGLFSSFSLH